LEVWDTVSENASEKVYLIDAWENHRWGWRKIGDMSVHTLVGYESIYIVSDSKIYFVEFKRVISLSRVNNKCKDIYYQGRWIVKECDASVRDLVLRNAKEIRQVPEDDQFMYQFIDVINNVINKH
jgi:hypothetical protein